MTELAKTMITGLGRAAIMALGGWIASKGYLDGSTITNVEGSLICLFGVALTLISKVHAAGKLDAARAEVPPGYVIAPPGSGPGQAQASMAPIPNP